MVNCLVTLLLPLAAAPITAEPVARTGEPYRIVIAIQFSDDPVFTRFFRGTVVREVRDQLANYFGGLAEVEVVTEHPLLDRLDEIPLSGVTLGPDQCADPPADKLFLVLVDCDGGTYRICWRQLSFEAQHVGPLGTRTTPDRHWLAKAICLAARDDFAPVALIEPGETRDQVRLHFHGADFQTEGKPRLAFWLKAGCVLQPLWVIRDRSGTLSRVPIPQTAIVLESSSDFSRGTVVTPRLDPWKRSPRVAGFQAIRIPTCPGRFRLRLRSAERPDRPVREGCTVFASANRFSTEVADRQPSPDRNGVVVSRPEVSFPGVAYVTIRHGASDYQVLVPISAPMRDVEYRLPEDPAAGLKADWQRRLRYLVQDVQALHGVADQQFQEVNALNSEKRYEEALQRVRAALRDQTSLPSVEKALAALADEAKKLGAESNSRLGWAQQQVQELRRRTRSLEHLEGSLAEAIRQIDARNRARVLRDLAFQSEASGDIDDAIEKYRLSLKEYPEQPALRRHLDWLEDAWKIKSPEHRDARQYVLKTFAAVRVQSLSDELPKARKVFETLRAAGDALAVRCLVRVLDRHLNDLAELVELLEGRGTETDRQDCDRYVKVSESVTQFRAEIRDWLVSQPQEPEPPPAEKPQPAEESPAGKLPAERSPEAGPQPASTLSPKGP
jgi:tetratricopeptide (TPR) repeat protein